MPCVMQGRAMQGRAINALDRLEHPNLGALSRTIKQKLRNLINEDDGASVQAANTILRAKSPVLLARVEEYAQSLEEGAAAGIFLPLFFAITHWTLTRRANAAAAHSKPPTGAATKAPKADQSLTYKPSSRMRRAPARETSPS